MKISPYANKRESEWPEITRQLIKKHPLKTKVLLEAATSAWDMLWKSTVGEGKLSVNISELSVPASVVGYFFEVLLARELARKLPKDWRGNRSNDEKDLVHLKKPEMSVEIKTSGQAGFKIYGNRSYGQKLKQDSTAKKEKSGYYITANFYGQSLTLIRFGWIDADDWNPQGPESGQKSDLAQNVYDYKLIPIAGSYRQQTPISFLRGVGPSKEAELKQLGIHTLKELFAFQGELPTSLAKIVEQNKDFIVACCSSE